MSNEDLFAAARAWVHAHYRGRYARFLKIELDGGDKICLPVPPLNVSDDATFDLTDSVKAVLENGAVLNAKQIAARTGYGYNSYLRQQLAQLVEADILEKTAGGYRLKT